MHRFLYIVMWIASSRNSMKDFLHEKSNGTKGRTERLFSMFSLVNFPNDECITPDSECGTCMTTSECSGIKGKVSGSCAQGFGSCCVIYQDSCGGTISQNRTYIRNPGFPSSYSTAGTCTWTLSKCSSDICQMRLDFETHSIAQPDTAGACTTDSFKGAPARTGRESPLICGENAGQHMYVEAGAHSSSNAVLTLTLSGSTARRWKIKVSMIECDSLSLPPQGCLQYHTGATGTVKSFNWDDSTAYEHLNNQHYRACIRQERGYCNIGWRQSDTSIDTFKPGRGDPTANNAFASLNEAQCETDPQGDFVIIPNGSDGGGYNGNCQSQTGAHNAIDKYCGGALTCRTGSTDKAEVVSNIRPFTLDVFFNGPEPANSNNRGIKLNYRQIVC